MEYDCSNLHQSSEPTVRGGDDTTKSGDVNSGNPSDMGANLVLDLADTDNFQAQASSTCHAILNTELSELEQQARQEHTCLGNKHPTGDRVNATPDRHETASTA